MAFYTKNPNGCVHGQLRTPWTTSSVYTTSWSLLRGCTAHAQMYSIACHNTEDARTQKIEGMRHPTQSLCTSFNDEVYVKQILGDPFAFADAENKISA